MQLPQDGTLLRIFIGEADKYEHKPLYEWIVLQAREQGLAGATVLRGMMGFGANTRKIHSFRFDTLSEDLPIIVEMVDMQEKLDKFLELIEPHIKAGLDCVACHGEVGQMHRVRRESDQTMGWCIDCHRQKGVSVDCYVCHR